MLLEFISKYTTNPYLISFFYLIIWFAIIRLGTFVIQKVVLKLTIKKRTSPDNLIISKSSKPLTLIAILIGVKIALDKLPWGERAINIINISMNTLIGVIALYLIYIIFDLSFTRVIKKVSRKRSGVYNEGLIQLTKSTLQVILVLAGFIYILKVWGVAIGPLLTGIGIGGIAIAFALQESLSNVFGGISIILDKSVNVGDLVNLEDGTTGKITGIGIRSTRVKTFDNEIVIVPNSKLANSNIKNVAQPEPITRITIPFSVAYGTDVNKVNKIVTQEIKKISGIVEEPESFVRFIEMGDSSLNFKAYIYLESYELRLTGIDEANTRIYNTLRKNKIEIPFPQMDVHMKKK
jgi:MscS family membrane protein